MRESILRQFERYKDTMSLGRVTSVHKNIYNIESNDRLFKGKTSGRFSFNVIDNSEYPVVGDYVIFRFEEYDDLCIIEKVCERYSELSRHHSYKGQQQLLVANTDLIFICVSLNNDYNIKKIQNLISLTYGTNSKSILLLTKSDLCSNIEEKVLEAKTLDDNLEIMVISSFNEEDISNIKEVINKDTAVFIGASGVGKSTIVNKLIGYDYFNTFLIRESDSQGRHTTVHRELVKLDSGGYIIDTPGLRLITSYYIDNIDDHFNDVSKYSEECSFRDCSHTHEPGCKVLEAVDNDLLPKERLNAYMNAQRFNRYIINKSSKEEMKAKRKLSKK